MIIPMNEDGTPDLTKVDYLEFISHYPDYWGNNWYFPLVLYIRNINIKKIHRLYGMEDPFEF